MTVEGKPSIATPSSDGRIHFDPIDPTKNVGDIIHAESRYQNDMRDALERMMTFARDADQRLQTLALSAEGKFLAYKQDAESRRVDQLAELRQIYESRIADMLSESVRSTSSLVSTQLVQIQSTFDARVSKLEEFRLLSTGRSSVADPQLASTLSQLAAGNLEMQHTFARALADMADKQTAAMAKIVSTQGAADALRSTDDGGKAARAQMGNYVVQGIMLLATVGLVAVDFFHK